MTSKSICTFRNGVAGLVLAAICNSSPAWAVPAVAYEAGMFTFKPLNVNIASINRGFRSPDSRFKATGLDATSGTVFPFFDQTRRLHESAFRTTVPLGFSESDRNAVAYGIEMGYLVYGNCEVFGRVGYSHERPMPRFTVGDRSYDFNARNNYALSLGLRHYMNTDSAWKPYLAAAFGFVSQGETKAKIYGHSLFANDPKSDPFIGKYKLLKRKALFSFELSLGTDYILNKNWALSASVAVRYNQRAGSTVINTPGVMTMFGPLPPRSDHYADSKQRWYIPVTVSLKFMF
jgi:hypothetical protein